MKSQEVLHVMAHQPFLKPGFEGCLFLLRVALGQDTRYRGLKACSNSTTHSLPNWRLCSNFLMASLASSTSQNVGTGHPRCPVRS